LAENVKFRHEIILWAAQSEQNQQDIISACTRDFMFFVNTFIWTSDVKRHPENPDRPFITWDFQEEVMLDLRDAIGKRSVGIIKSRDIGGTVMPIYAFTHVLLFFQSYTLMLLSRNEKFVDDASNPDSLFAKLDYTFRWMPSWMVANLHRKKLTYENLRLNSNIIGSSSSADAGRGGRKQAVFIDEHAAWDRKESIELIGSLQHNTKCRIWVSTPKGIGNGFHQIITGGATRVHRLHWSKHPVHGAGLYTTKDGKVDILDQEYWRHATAKSILDSYPELEKKFPPCDGLAVTSYPFILDGKLRSPYYDYETFMCPIPKLNAQELDMDFIGSGSPFFDIDELNQYVAQHALKPFHYGEITYDLNLGEGSKITTIDEDSIKWQESPNGRFQMWMHPTIQGKAPIDRAFVIGVDICTGSGVCGSNSHISVGDALLRSKVAGFTVNNMGPHAFAEYVFAVGKYFNFPTVIFEGSGPGESFAPRLRELGYPSIYWMTKTNGKRPEKPGFFHNGDSKRELLEEYGRALTMREFTNHDETAVNECQMFQFTETGTIEHVESSASADPSGAKKNHGDRVMADAMCWKVLRKMVNVEPKEIIHGNSLARLQQDIERNEVGQDEWCVESNEEAWCRVGA
jgi:hypothetical protein